MANAGRWYKHKFVRYQERTQMACKILFLRTSNKSKSISIRKNFSEEEKMVFTFSSSRARLASVITPIIVQVEVILGVCMRHVDANMSNEILRVFIYVSMR